MIPHYRLLFQKSQYFRTLDLKKCSYRLNSAVRQIGVCRADSRFPVIARPVRTLVVAIPLLREEMYRIVPERVEVATVFGGNRYLVPFNRGIATPVCALVRNDSKNVQTKIYLFAEKYSVQPCDFG